MKRLVRRIFTIATLLTISVIGLTSAPAFAATEFPHGYVFPINQPFDNSHGRLIFQSDGNLVVYNEFGQPLWSTNTRFEGKQLTFQGDGNLVMADGFNRAVWTSNTSGTGFRMIWQDDGNLVISDLANHAVWATNTSH